MNPTITTENVDTTADAPLCVECGGNGSISMFITPDEFGGMTCEPCDGTGYQCGDNASLLASEPPEEDEPVNLGALFLAARDEIFTPTRFEFMGETTQATVA